MDDDVNQPKLKLSQANIGFQLALYLVELKKQDKENHYDNERLIQQLTDPKKGECSGHTTLWIYCILLESNVPRNQQLPHSRHDFQWLFKTRRLIARWDGNIYSLSEQNKKDFDYFLSYIIQFQKPNFYFSAQQGQLESFVDDTKNHRLERRDIISGLFSFGQITQILEELSDNTAAYFGSYGPVNHSIGIYKSNRCYFFFDSNIEDYEDEVKWLNENLQRQPYYTNDSDWLCSMYPGDITLRIFMSLTLANKKYVPLRIMEFGIKDIQQPKKILWDVNNTQPALEYEECNTLIIACSACDLRTVKYYLKNQHTIPKNLYHLALVFAVGYQHETIFKLLLELPAESFYSIPKRIASTLLSFANYMLEINIITPRNNLENNKNFINTIAILTACFSGKLQFVINFFQKYPDLHQHVEIKNIRSLPDVLSDALVDFKTESTEILLDFILKIQKSTVSSETGRDSSYSSSAMTLFSHQDFTQHYKKLAEGLMREIIDSPCHVNLISDILNNYKIKSQKIHEIQINIIHDQCHDDFITAIKNIENRIVETIGLSNQNFFKI